MNRKQRILFSLVITFVFSVGLLLARGIEALVGWSIYLSIIPLALIIMPAGVYFLSFKIWDKAEQKAAKDGRPRTGGIVHKSQRILLALVITIVFPINALLARGIDILTGEYLGEWMLIPTSIILAVGVYFLSFKIWDKTEQEVGKGEG